LGDAEMDNENLNELLQKIGERQVWIKQWGHPDFPPEEGQQVFDAPTYTIGFGRNPYRVNVGDFLIVYRIKVAKIMFIAETIFPPTYVTDEEVERNPLLKRWRWNIEAKNLTPAFGAQWSNYSLKPFALAAEYNKLNPHSKVKLGSLNRGGGVLGISESFGKFIIEKVLQLETAGSTFGSNWSDEEIRETVESYFEMLRNELQGRPYSKTHFRNDLLTRINRTKGAVEYKYQNVSASLVAKGLPYVEGYKPASNYQMALDDAIDGYIEAHPEFLPLVAQAIEDTVEERPEENFTNVLEDPPARTERDKDGVERKRSYQARKYDFTQRENNKLGWLGEEFVVDYERQRLTEAGKPDLAIRVERISETRGDGAGYDVLSFEEDGTERYIEVKTTNSGKNYPFYISANELDFSEDFSEKYYLYRVFNFKKSPKLFMLRGSLKERYELTATVFRVSF
jgi:Domain of unknown function (DUF3883)